MTKINSKPLGIFTDNILGVSYSLDIVSSAKELGDMLKSVLKKNEINYHDYNGHKDDYFNKSKDIDKNPPVEIYEYQNFFVLQRKNGDLVLLDGFRRLLWYDAPSTPIIVRYYLESELTDQQILTLLVNLNHFKFFSDQAYHERGFSLLLKTVFDIDIMQMKKSFDAYLSSSETKNSYSSSYNSLTKQSKNEEIKRRIVNKFFINDLRFLQTIQNEGFLADQFMGALTYEMRSKSDKEFDSTKFISLVKDNKVLLDLMVKYDKVGTDNSARSQEIVNKIIEMYRNIFTIMDGGEVEKSFAEKQREAKDLVEKFKKDKSLVKMTGNQDIHIIDRILTEKLKNSEEIEFFCVVHPSEHEKEYNHLSRETKAEKIPFGIVDGIKFIGYHKKHFTEGGGLNIDFGIVIGDEKFIIKHNYKGKRYTYIESGVGGNRYNVDLFVKLELEKKPKSSEPRKMKEFTYGRGRRDGMGYCVLAWTQKEAKELFSEIGIHLSDSEMRNYVGKAFGTVYTKLLENEDLSKPCVYGIKDDNTIVKLK